MHELAQTHQCQASINLEIHRWSPKKDPRNEVFKIAGGGRLLSTTILLHFWDSLSDSARTLQYQVTLVERTWVPSGQSP
jgi:hypothetical protein